MKKFWKFKAVSSGALTIELLEPIGEDSWTGEGKSAKAFSEELAAAGHISELRVRIASPGGNVVDALAMFDSLVRHPANVLVDVIFAASAASIVAMGGDRIRIVPEGLFMIHLPTTLAAGNAVELRKVADVLDKATQPMISAYRRKSPKTEAEILRALERETWFSAEEAIAFGLAQEITPDEEEDDLDMAAILHAPIAARFRHMPAQLAARFTRRTEPDATTQLMVERERQRLQVELLRRLP